MGILVVDDSEVSRRLLSSILESSGYEEVVLAESAEEALEQLGAGGSNGDGALPFDLVLMDLFLPEMNGVEATRVIKSRAHLRDLPVIMITASGSSESLEDSFAAGASDYIKKPFTRAELLTRVQAVLALKSETDAREARERELLEARAQLESANAELRRLAVQDGLTGIANRRVFEETAAQEWNRAVRKQTALSLLLVDIDHFKEYNDLYGHVAGDSCLRRVAAALGAGAQRAMDLVARYGGEKFAVLLPGKDEAAAFRAAEIIHATVDDLGIPHEASPVARQLTLSVGCATKSPSASCELRDFVQVADQALYRAKAEGRNCSRAAGQRDLIPV